MEEFCSSFTSGLVTIRDGVLVDKKPELDEESISIHKYLNRCLITYRINNTDIILVIQNAHSLQPLYIHLSINSEKNLMLDLLLDKSKLIMQLNDYVNSDEDFERKLLNIIKIVSSRFKALTDEPFIIGQTKSANHITVLPVNHT